NQASTLLPIGTKLAIRNPYYQVASSLKIMTGSDSPMINTDFETIIRSDNPSDVIIIDHDNKLFNKIKWSVDSPESYIYKRNERSIDDDDDDDKRILSADDFCNSGNERF